MSSGHGRDRLPSQSPSSSAIHFSCPLPLVTTIGGSPVVLPPEQCDLSVRFKCGGTSTSQWRNVCALYWDHICLSFHTMNIVITFPKSSRHQRENNERLTPTWPRHHWTSLNSWVIFLTEGRTQLDREINNQNRAYCMTCQKKVWSWWRRGFESSPGDCSVLPVQGARTSNIYDETGKYF